jgi:hypothetical protein
LADETLLSSNRLSEFDFGRLRELAAEVSPSVASYARVVQNRIQWLVDNVNSISHREAWSSDFWLKHLHGTIAAQEALRLFSNELK